MRVRLFLAVTLAVATIACKGGAGPKGATGDKGDTGDPGAGTAGKSGTNGTNGTNGAMGAVGAKGADGAKGTTGTTGATGATGADGTNGNDIILSENARVGLKLSEVAVDLTGLGADEIESVGRGAYLMNAVADCKGCHNSPDGKFLAGNLDVPIGGFDNTGAPCTVGTSGCTDGHVFTRNLTPDATTGLKLTEEQFLTALRTGRDFKDATGGTTLIVMPWAQLRWLATQDIRDIYHYLQHIPAVDNAVNGDMKPVFPPPPSPFFDSGGVAIDVPEFKDGAVVRKLPAAFDLAAGKATAAEGEKFDNGNVLRGLAISPLADDAVANNLSPASNQALYGRGSYIVNGPGLCNECHTPGGRNQNGTVKTVGFLSGGQAFGVPPPLQPMNGQVRTMSGNLTGKDHGFKLSFALFDSTWNSGMSFTNAMGPHPLGWPMPFDIFRNMSNDDKLAVYTYITTIQAQAFITGDTQHQMPSRYCSTAADCDTTATVPETCVAIMVGGVATKECTGGACNTTLGDADCGACQTCDRVLHGTLALTNGSTAVTGTGTAFTTEGLVAGTSQIRPGAQTSASYVVASITDATHLTLSSNYSGTTAASSANNRIYNGTSHVCVAEDPASACVTTSF